MSIHMSEDLLGDEAGLLDILPGPPDLPRCRCRELGPGQTVKVHGGSCGSIPEIVFETVSI